MTPRLATLVLFFVNGVVVGTWVASIPGVQTSLRASATELGLVLLVAAFGSLLAQQVTGQLLMRVSSRRIVMVSSLVFPLLAPLPLLAPSALLLAVALFLFGYLNATMDLSMNAHGVAIEARGERSIFSGLHAGWSLGAFSGALGVATAAALGIEPAVEAAAVGVVLWLAVVMVVRSLGMGSRRTEGTGGIHLPSRRTLPVALLIIPAAFVAGAMADWGGVYLRQGAGSSIQLAAFAFAAYSLGLFLGRSGGDVVKDRIGSARLMQAGSLAAVISTAAFLIVGNPYLALAGMTIAGIGLANNIPQLFGAAGRIAPVGPSLSAVFTFATLSFMLEPAIMGVASDALGIGMAMFLPVAASLLLVIAVTRVPAAETSPRFAVQLTPEPSSQAAG